MSLNDEFDPKIFFETIQYQNKICKEVNRKKENWSCFEPNFIFTHYLDHKQAMRMTYVYDATNPL